MNSRYACRAWFLVGTLCLPLAVQADEIPAELALGIGAFSPFESAHRAKSVRVELHGGEGVFGIRPLAGLFATSDSSVYGFAGLYAHFGLGEDWVLTPSFSAGLYHHGGGKDLYATLQFREQIELGYRMENGHRLGLEFAHISNGGFGDHNPGAETLSVSYTVPFGATNDQ